MKITPTNVDVGGQERDVRFATGTLGFEEKTDVWHGAYRWLAAASPGNPDGTEPPLARNDSRAVAACRQALAIDPRRVLAETPC